MTVAVIRSGPSQTMPWLTRNRAGATRAIAGGSALRDEDIERPLIEYRDGTGWRLASTHRSPKQSTQRWRDRAGTQSAVLPNGQGSTTVLSLTAETTDAETGLRPALYNRAAETVVLLVRLTRGEAGPIGVTPHVGRGGADDSGHVVVR